jgi:lysozyme
MAPPSKTSSRGVEFVASFEGWVNHPYNDPAGNATIGYGHLLHLGKVTADDIRKWGTISHTTGLELLAADLHASERCLLEHVRPPLERTNRFDAMASFVFNLGCGPVSGETHLAESLNNPLRTGMPAAILPYDHAGGVVLPGLTRRRRAEAHLWTTGNYTWP